MRDHHKLRVFQRARQLVVEVYRVTEFVRAEEQYGLALQMRRASVSVASNIAEGSSRSSDADFARFIEIALGSVRELECQLSLTQELGMARLDLGPASALCDETARMLLTLLRRLKPPLALSSDLSALSPTQIPSDSPTPSPPPVPPPRTR